MITVYGLPRSRSTRALWALEEAGQAYEFIALNFAKGEQQTDAYLALNPGAKVPTLVEGDLILTESAAIVKAPLINSVMPQA
jgi:glutathione S-transferase